MTRELEEQLNYNRPTISMVEALKTGIICQHENAKIWRIVSGVLGIALLYFIMR